MLETSAACSIYSQYTLKSEWQRRFTGIASSSLKAIWKIVDWIECNEVHMISWIWSDHYTDAKETSSSSIIRLDTAWNTADRLYLILSKLNLIIRIIQTIQRWQLNSSGISRTICEGWCIFFVSVAYDSHTFGAWIQVLRGKQLDQSKIKCTAQCETNWKHRIAEKKKITSSCETINQLSLTACHLVRCTNSWSILRSSTNCVVSGAKTQIGHSHINLVCYVAGII